MRTINDGLKKSRDGDLDTRLNRLPSTHRSTPNVSGKLSSELLLGYQIRSVVGTCFPPLIVPSLHERKPCAISPGDCVFDRNFGFGKPKTPGVVQAASGARMVTVQTPLGMVQRHVDQLRNRLPGTGDYEKSAEEPQTAAVTCSRISEDNGEPLEPDSSKDPKATDDVQRRRSS